MAGLLSFVSPCILPIVPPYLCFLAGVSFEQLSETGTPDARRPTRARRRVDFAARAFVLGFATIFTPTVIFLPEEVAEGSTAG